MDSRIVEDYVIVGQYNCTYCDKAKDLCNRAGRSYTYYDLEEHRWLKTLLARAGLKTVPQIFNHTGLLIGGFSDLEERK